MTKLLRSEGCTCHDRAWFGPYHDTQCPLWRGRDRTPVAAEIRDALEWYADEVRYARVHRAADSHGEYAASDVMFDQGLRAKQALNHLLTTSEVEEANWFAAKVEKVAERIARSPCHLGTREDAFILAREAVEEMGQ